MKCEKTKFPIILSVISLILSIIALCIAAYRTPSLNFDYLGLLIGILTLLTTVLIGWQIFNIIELNSLRREIDKTIKRSIGERIINNNYTISAVVHQIDGLLYSGLPDKDVNHALSLFFEALEELIKANNKEPLDGIVECILSVIEENEKLIRINKHQYLNYIKICNAINGTNKIKEILMKYRPIDLNKSANTDKTKDTVCVKQENKNGDNISASNDVVINK